MKKITQITTVLLLFVITANGQETFDTPAGWRSEHSAFPPSFAPTVKLKGMEDIRFPAGWRVSTSSEYWSVAYFLWLDNGQRIDAGVLKEMLKTYYDGLVIIGGGAVPHNIPKDKLIPTRVEIKKIKPEPHDVETYSGTIDMLDYMAMKPITLNYRVHLKTCGNKDHFPLFFEISPKPFTDKIWSSLTSMKTKFTCKD